MNYVEIAELVFNEQDRFVWVGECISTDKQFEILNGTTPDEETVLDYESTVTHQIIEDQVMHILLIAAMEGEL